MVTNQKGKQKQITGNYSNSRGRKYRMRCPYIYKALQWFSQLLIREGNNNTMAYVRSLRENNRENLISAEASYSLNVPSRKKYTWICRCVCGVFVFLMRWTSSISVEEFRDHRRKPSGKQSRIAAGDNMRLKERAGCYARFTQVGPKCFNEPIGKSQQTNE